MSTMVHQSKHRIRMPGFPLVLLCSSLLLCFKEGFVFSFSSSKNKRPYYYGARSAKTTSRLVSLETTATSNLIAVSDSNYRDLFNGEKLLLLDACAQWCGPCKLIEPLLGKCAEDWKETVVVGKFDVEDKNSRDLKIELILKGVMPKALPALILIHNNKVLDNWKGIISPEQLQELLKKHVITNHPQEVLQNEKGPSATNFEQIPIRSEMNSPASRPFRGINFANRF